MAFKSEKQRRCVMALLNKNMTNTQFKTIINKGVQNKVISKKQSVKILHSDFDKDGVKNKNDCRPLNKKEQGRIHRKIKEIKNSDAFKKLPKSKQQELNKALNKLSKSDTGTKIALWIAKHDKLLQGAGFGAVLPIIVSTAAFPPAAILATFPAAVAAAGTGFIGKLSSDLKSKNTRELIRNQSKIKMKLINKGFTKKQANVIFTARLRQIGFK